MGKQINRATFAPILSKSCRVSVFLLLSIFSALYLCSGLRAIGSAKYLCPAMATRQLGVTHRGTNYLARMGLFWMMDKDTNVFAGVLEGVKLSDLSLYNYHPSRERRHFAEIVGVRGGGEVGAGGGVKIQ